MREAKKGEGSRMCSLFFFRYVQRQGRREEGEEMDRDSNQLLKHCFGPCVVFEGFDDGDVSTESSVDASALFTNYNAMG